MTDLESGDALEAGAVAEYDELEKDIELWVRTQQQQRLADLVRKPRPARGQARTARSPDTTLIPADVKSKLRRLIALKEQLAAAATAEAVGAYTTANGGGGKLTKLAQAGAGSAGGTTIEMGPLEAEGRVAVRVAARAVRMAAVARGTAKATAARRLRQRRWRTAPRRWRRVGGRALLDAPEGATRSVVLAATDGMGRLSVVGAGEEVVDVENEHHSPHASPVRRNLALPSSPADVWADDRADGRGGESGEAAGEAGREGGLAGSSSGGLVSSSAYLDDLDDDDEDETKWQSASGRATQCCSNAAGGICYTARGGAWEEGRGARCAVRRWSKWCRSHRDGCLPPQHGHRPGQQSSLPEEIDLQGD